VTPVSTGPVPPAAPAPRTPLVSDRGAARHDVLRAEVWSSQGTTKVLHDAEIGRAALVGTSTIGGSLRATQIGARGLLEVVGAFEVQETGTVRGELRAGSSVHAGELRVQGILRATGPVRADRHIEVSGTLEGPSVTAAEAVLEGGILVPDLIRADRVQLRPADRSRIGRIEGQEVRIRAKVAGPVEALLGAPLEVVIGRVDGARVELEGVQVGLVHADEVVLGRHARVRTVEGTVRSAHRTSHVGPESRSRPPPGLSR